MFFVYILACRATGRTYVGQTDHLIQRFRLYCAGSTRTTREKLVSPMVVYWEAFPCRADAMLRERYFKAGAGARRKAALVAQFLRSEEGVDSTEAPREIPHSSVYGGHSSVG